MHRLPVLCKEELNRQENNRRSVGRRLFFVFGWRGCAGWWINLRKVAKTLLQRRAKWCTIKDAFRSGISPIFPPVAKLDIAVDSDSKGRGFESLRAGQKIPRTSFSEFFYPSRRLGISSPRKARCISSRASVYPPTA